MAQSNLEVSNGALIKCGAPVITALAGTDKASTVCNARVDICKKTVLRMHPWNFAVKRKVITPYPDYAVSNVTFVSANLIEVTHASGPTYVAGHYLRLVGIQGAQVSSPYEVASVPGGTTVRLTAPDIAVTGDLGTYTASDTDYIRRSPAFDFEYLYDLPSDCLRVLRVNEYQAGPQWRVEGRFIAADDETVEIKYVYDVTDYTTMDALFYECLAAYMAWDICFAITGDNSLKNQLWQDFRLLAPFARFVDATEDAMEKLEARDWVDSRQGGSSWVS